MRPFKTVHAVRPRGQQRTVGFRLRVGFILKSRCATQGAKARCILDTKATGTPRERDRERERDPRPGRCGQIVQIVHGENSCNGWTHHRVFLIANNAPPPPPPPPPSWKVYLSVRFGCRLCPKKTFLGYVEVCRGCRLGRARWSYYPPGNKEPFGIDRHPRGMSRLRRVPLSIYIVYWNS